MFKKWAGWLAFELETRRRRRVLHGLSDRMLKDIGLGRSEIDHVTLAHCRPETGPRGR